MSMNVQRLSPAVACHSILAWGMAIIVKDDMAHTRHRRV
jgi:hypothetical protein